MLALMDLVGGSLHHLLSSGSVAMVMAGPTPPPNPADIPQLDTFLTNIQRLLMTIGGTIFIICVIVAGLMRMLSFGNERRVAISNMAFTAAVIGLAIVLLAVAFHTFISQAI